MVSDWAMMRWKECLINARRERYPELAEGRAGVRPGRRLMVES
jgi:hypothetical protein